MKTAFEKAQSEFMGLPGVNNDPMAQHSIADLVSAAVFEVDLFEEGESELGLYEIRQIRRWLRKWNRERFLSEVQQ